MSLETSLLTISDMAQFQVLQPETTYTGSPIQPLQKGLPKTTQSLCPDCSQLIDARILEDAGKVVMEKRCPTMATSATSSIPTPNCT